MTNRKIQIESAVNPAGAQQGFQQIEEAGRKAAGELKKAAGEAGKAVDGIGDGGQQSAGKVDRATKSIINSIERTTAALQVGERGSASYFEALARQRGVSGEALAPYIAQLRAAEQAQQAARASLNGIGVSAAQTAAALRGVPAQFTDIVTSLQGGQAPLTVFLQQGGQLRDMFGSAGAAARALGGFVVGLISPFTVLAGAVGALAIAYKLGSDEATAYSRALILSGQQAGVTAGQLAEMAAAISAMGAGTQGRAAEVLAGIADSAEIGAGNLQRFVAAALELEKVGGPAAEQTAEAFRSLAKDPLAAALKLNEATNFLTASTYAQIKALQDQGRATEAAKLAQEAYAQAIETRAPQLAGSLGYVERAWLAIKSAAKGALDAALDVGRGNTLEGQINAVRERIAAAQSGIYSRDKVPALQQELALLQEQQRLLNRGAEAAAAQAAAVRATAEWDKEAVKYQTDGKKLADEILQIRQRGIAAGKTEAQITELIAAAVERTAKAPAAAGAGKAPRFKAEEQAARSYVSALAALSDIQLQASASGEGLTKTQAKLRDVQADPAWQTYSRQQREQIITQAAAAQAAEDQAAAVKAGAKVAADAARDYQQYLKALSGSGDAVTRQVQALQDEGAAAQIAATGRLSLKAAIEEVTIARLRDAQVAALGNEDAVQAIQREIDARIKLRDAIQQKDQRDTAAAAAKEAEREWTRAADKIEQSLTDALLRGFESGKDFAANLRDTVANMFKTLVLRPVISAVVSPVAGAITGALGLAGGASAATSAATAGSGVLGSIGSAASLGSLAAGAGAFGTGISSGLSAWGAGGSVTGLLSTGVGGIFSGGMASGLGTLAGALGPIALGIGALAGAWDSLFGRKLKQSGIEGTISADGFDGNNFQFYKGGLFRSNKTRRSPLDEEVESALDSAAQAVSGSTRAYAEALGLPASAIDGFTQRIKINLKGLSEEASKAAIDKAFTNFGESLALRFGNELVGVSRAGESAGATLRRLAESLVGVNNIRASLGQSELSQSTRGGAAASDLLASFGGINEFAQAAEGYLSAIFSESERLEIAQRNLAASFAQLGQAVPASAAAYRALVDAQDLSTEAGRNTYTALLRLAPAFGEVTAAAQQATEQQAQLAQRRAAEGFGLETRLLQLQGDTAALRERELQALDPINRALQERIYALEDQQAIEQASARAAEAAAAERARLSEQAASEADNLGARLMQLIGDVAGLRARELASLSPANRALQERIYALEDAQAAEAAAAETERQQAALAQQVAQQGESLLTRLLQLQGDTATLRARELAALDPANRALQERIYALEDAQAAAQAAQELAAQWRGVSETLEDEIKRIGGLNRSQAASLAEVQADFATATAQARAGDRAAAERLPELSRTLLEMARGSARSALELSAVQASVVASLTQTADVVRGLAAGPLSNAQDAVQSLMPDTIAAQLLSADQAKAASTTTSQADMLAELRALRAEVVDLRAEARATAGNTATLSRLHQRWDGGDGLRVVNDADTPLTTTVI